MAIKRYSAFPQSRSFTGTSPSDCLVSYLGHLLGGVLHPCREVVGLFYSPRRLAKIHQGMMKNAYNLTVIWVVFLTFHHHHLVPSTRISLTLYHHPLYRSALPAGPHGYTLYPHRAAVCRFELVALLLLGHVKGSIRVHHFSSSVLQVWFV